MSQDSDPKVDNSPQEDIEAAIKAIRGMDSIERIVGYSSASEASMDLDQLGNKEELDHKNKVVLLGACTGTLQARRGVVDEIDDPVLAWAILVNIGLNICSICRNQIPAGRIAARPETCLCIDCLKKHGNGR